jgi:hypothetical protein
MKVRYVVPASLLYQAAAMLQPPEKVVFVTGIKLSGLFGERIILLTQLMPVGGAESRVHVEPDPAAVLRIHKSLVAMGMDIEAQFHSHPGRAKCATRPSSVDLNTARRWEAEAPFLGAVFSEGGAFVRFFNYEQISEIRVYGNCNQTDEPCTFQLSQIDRTEMPRAKSQPGGLVANRPAGEDFLVEPEKNS